MAFNLYFAEVLAPAAPAPGPDDEAVPHDEAECLLRISFLSPSSGHIKFTSQMPAAAGGMEEIQAIRDAQVQGFESLKLKSILGSCLNLSG